MSRNKNNKTNFIDDVQGTKTAVTAHPPMLQLCKSIRDQTRRIEISVCAVCPELTEITELSVETEPTELIRWPIVDDS